MANLHMCVWPEGVPHHLELPAQSVAQNLINTAARLPDHPAILFHGREITYRALLAQVDAMAGYLQRVCGIAKGDRVLLYAQNSPQFIIGYYAIMRAGAAVVPVNPMNRHAELLQLTEDTGARVAIAGSELLDFIQPLVGDGHLNHIIVGAYADMADPAFDLKLPDPLGSMSETQCSGAGVVRWSDVIRADHRPAALDVGLNDLALIPYSSGTTGHPKGCTHLHRSVQTTAIGGTVWQPVDHTAVHLSVLPLFHVTGMTNGMNGPIYVGGTIVVMTRWDRRLAAQLIARHRITRWRSISTMVIDLVNDPEFDSYNLRSLRAIGGGGAAMPAAVAAKLHEMTGLDYIEGYGLSETIGGTHINPPQKPRRQCLGIPVMDVDSRILSLEDGRVLGPNETGEIIVNGQQVFEGYWNRPDATADAFVELDGKRFFRTGDIGMYDDEGYFFMVDRVKRMINASGFKVWPAEVETLMHHCPDVAEVCVIGALDPRRGETVKAYVVPTQHAKGRATEQSIIAWCAAEMAAYKCPKSVIFIDALPKSGTGKVLWRRLTETDAACGGNAIKTTQTSENCAG